MVEYFTFFFGLSLLITLTNSIEDDNDKKYLIFPFKRNLTSSKSMTPEQFFITEIYNQIYINMFVGSNKQNIPFYLYLQQYPTVLQSTNAKKGEVKGIYNELKSNTYKKLSEKVVEFEKGDLIKGILSEDTFYFNSTSSSIKFYLSVENYGDSHITEGGKLGFRYFNEYNESLESNFVIKLKNLGKISSYDIAILYDSNKLDDDNGKLLIGALPHEVYNQAYNKSDIKSANSNTYGQWEIYFQKIALGNEIFDRQNGALFYPEFGFIVGSYNFFDLLNILANWSEIFNSSKCHSYQFQITDMEANDITRFLFWYTGYYCEKDVNVDNIINESLTFTSTDFAYEFKLNNKDIWMEKNGYKYFLILKSLNSDNTWILGRPFFKRFHMNFNLDSKNMIVYPNVNFVNKPPDNEINYISVYTLIISSLILIIGVLAFFLIRNYIYAPRKKRANELVDDDFEYKGGNTQEENKIIPGEGD